MRWRIGIMAVALAGCTTLLPGTDTFGDAGAAEDGGMDAAIDGGGLDAGPDADGLDAGDTQDADFDAGPDAGGPAVPVSLALGERHSCALLSDGRVACWGDDRSGQVSGSPIAGPPNWRPPTTLGLPAAAERVCAGGAFTCAATARLVFCWGDNSRGQLATGDLLEAPGRNPVMFPGQPASAPIDDLGCGQEHACAIVSGSTYCWGDNLRHQIDGTATPARATPLVVRDAGATDPYDQLFVGRDHSCASNSTSTDCWGENTQDQICSACADTVFGPTQVIAGGAPVAAGGDFTVGYTSSAVRVLTDAVPNLAPSPDPADLRQIRAGDRIACWSNAANEIRCWGDVVTALGAPSNPSGRYVSPSGANASAFDVGYNHLCAIADGEIWCVGGNILRQASPVMTSGTRIHEPTVVSLAGI